MSVHQLHAPIPFDLTFRAWWSVLDTTPLDLPDQDGGDRFEPELEDDEDQADDAS